MPTIFLLNGAGSAGKTAIARVLQEIATQPFLHVKMDSFLEMMPERYLDHPDGLSFEVGEDDGQPSTFAKTGPVGEQALSGMRRAVAGLAAAGNNLIVDEVIFGDPGQEHHSTLSEYRRLLAPFDLYLIGVFASLETLESRERQRGDRHIGLARWQYNRVHEGIRYDLSVCTDRASPQDCARQIKTHFNL